MEGAVEWGVGNDGWGVIGCVSWGVVSGQRSMVHNSWGVVDIGLSVDWGGNQRGMVSHSQWSWGDIGMRYHGWSVVRAQAQMQTALGLHGFGGHLFGADGGDHGEQDDL